MIIRFAVNSNSGHVINETSADPEKLNEYLSIDKWRKIKTLIWSTTLHNALQFVFL